MCMWGYRRWRWVMQCRCQRACDCRHRHSRKLWLREHCNRRKRCTLHGQHQQAYNRWHWHAQISQRLDVLVLHRGDILVVKSITGKCTTYLCDWVGEIHAARWWGYKTMESGRPASMSPHLNEQWWAMNVHNLALRPHLRPSPTTALSARPLRSPSCKVSESQALRLLSHLSKSLLINAMLTLALWSLRVKSSRTSLVSAISNMPLVQVTACLHHATSRLCVTSQSLWLWAYRALPYEGLMWTSQLFITDSETLKSCCYNVIHKAISFRHSTSTC